jgi:hypothetical protein
MSMGNENRLAADEGVIVFILRRLLFAAGAMLLAGGWGLTGFVGQNQHVAGDDAYEWWFEGVELSPDGPQPYRALAQTGRAGASPTLEQVFQMLESDGGGSSPSADPPQPPADDGRTLWPLMRGCLLGVAAMVVGAGVMGLAAPWREADDGGDYGSTAHMPLRLQRGP